MDYRTKLIHLCERLGIDDGEAGEDYWQHYLTVEQIEGAILRLRPDQRVTVGHGDDRESGTLDRFNDQMAIVRWDQGTLTSCPIEDIDDEDCP